MFSGFLPKTLDFLTENRLQNSKIWFEEHREDYQKYVMEPLKEFVLKLTPAMHEIDPLIVSEPKVDRSISRIYRDTRFSKDKSLYREVMWCVFIRDKKLFNGLPGYYFEISPSGYSYGMGYYEAGTDSMESFRRLILKRDTSFIQAFEAYSNQNVFTIMGADYKKTKYADQPDDIRIWLDKKTFHFSHSSVNFNMLYSPELTDEISAGFKLIKPIYEFLCKVEMNK